MASPPHPPFLYQYHSFDVQSLENLKNQVIYFGSPRNFNDPYDCALIPFLTPPSDEEVELVRAYYLALPDLPSETREEFTLSM